MMDEFDEKRGMVKKLLDMLKEHASSEVSTGLTRPEGEGDMHGLEVERVETAPHEMDNSTPEHDVDTKEYNKGGLVMDKVNAIDPTPKIHSAEAPMESSSGSGQPEMEGAAHKEVMKDPLRNTTEELEEPVGTKYTDAEEEQPSMFASFLSRKRKK